MKRLFPILLLAMVIIILLVDVNARRLAAQIQGRIDSEREALTEENEDLSTLIARLSTQAAQPKVELVTRMQSIASTECTARWLMPRCRTTSRELKLRVPMVVGPGLQPQEVERIERIRSTQNQKAAEIKKLTDEKKKVETFAGMDRNLVRDVLSLLAVIMCAYVVLSKSYQPETKSTALGLTGTLVGYWFGV